MITFMEENFSTFYTNAATVGFRNYRHAFRGEHLKTLSHSFAVSSLNCFFVFSFFFRGLSICRGCCHTSQKLLTCLVFEYYASSCTICIFLLVRHSDVLTEIHQSMGHFARNLKLLVRIGPLLVLVLTCVPDLPLTGACIGLSACSPSPSKTFQIKSSS